MRPGPSFVLLASLAAACASEPAVDHAKGAIIGGTRDFEHHAVVAVVSKTSTEIATCSGTIVASDPVRTLAWVVTAAHCVESAPTEVILVAQASHLRPTTLRVLDWVADDRYEHTPGSPYDFAVIRVKAPEGTPFIPLAGPEDDLEVGNTVTSVGFGRTTVEEDPGASSTARHAVTKRLDEVTPVMLGFDMATSGFCLGDSGGPLLAGNGTTPRVVGVHSFVGAACNVRGFSGRVSAAADFFARELAIGHATERCDRCARVERRGGRCRAAVNACLERASCRELYTCRQEHPADECFASEPAAERLYLAAADCGCVGDCQSACTRRPEDAGVEGGASEAGADASSAPPVVLHAECSGTARCGLTLARQACQACVETSCCAEALDAMADSDSSVCLGSLAEDVADLRRADDDPRVCRRRPPWQSLHACASRSCASACSGRAEPVAPVPADAGAAMAPRRDLDAVRAPPPSEPDPPAAAPAREPAGCSVVASSPGHGGTSSFFFLGAALGALSLRRRSSLRSGPTRA